MVLQGPFGLSAATPFAMPAPPGIEESGKVLNKLMFFDCGRLQTQRIECVPMQVLVEYVWLGSSGSDLRSKTRVLDARPMSVEEVPIIVVDGRQGNNLTTQPYCALSDSLIWNCSAYGREDPLEVFLKPRKLFRDPFRQGEHLLVLCDSYNAKVRSHALPVWREPSVKPLRLAGRCCQRDASSTCPRANGQQHKGCLRGSDAQRRKYGAGLRC